MSSEQETLNNDAPLSMSDAISALTATETVEDVREDQADPEDEQEGETAEDELPTDEEGEDEEGDQDDEDEDQAEDGEDDEPDSEQGRFVADNAKVKLIDADGKEVVVSVADLKKGSLLHADYTRKTQEAAELRRTAEAQSESVKQAEQQIIEQREYMLSLLQSVAPQPPSREKLRVDPIGYWEDVASYDEAKEQFDAHIQYITGQNQQVQTKRQAELHEKRIATAQTEWTALLEKAPDLRDKSKFTAFEGDLNTFASEYGFTPQEVAEALPYDHRMALVFKDAIEMRKLRASKPAVTRKTEARPPVAKGGKRLNPGAHQARQAQASMERLTKTGSLQDGVAAYLALEKKG